MRSGQLSSGESCNIKWALNSLVKGSSHMVSMQIVKLCQKIILEENN